jgi:hypothetical protein
MGQGKKWVKGGNKTDMGVVCTSLYRGTPLILHVGFIL